MDIKEHMQSDKLERYAFLWSMTRMVIAALSLFFGATPIIYHLSIGYSGLSSLLQLCWLISGVASAYLLYRWFTGGQKVFGATDTKNKVFFLIMVATGLNLGYTAIDTNIGMGLVIGMPIAHLLFKATGILYLIVAYYLWTQWKENGERIVS